MIAVLIRISTQTVIKKGQYPSLTIEPIASLEADLEWLLVNNLPKPSYNASTQRLVAFEEITTDPHPDYSAFNQYRTGFNVVDLTEQEIQEAKKRQSESNQQSLIDKKLKEQVLSDAQSNDDTTALDNQDLFPFWLTDFDYTIDFKCQDFNNLNELKLYKCVQAHKSQSDWKPKDVPALFTVVAYPNEIPVWVQPTGAQDAYNIGDQVYYPDLNGSVYESLINANVWSPVAYTQGWQLI